jgi:hypothetical protein
MARSGEELPLDPEAREALLRAGAECTFVWSAPGGWPLGVTMSYLWARERFWLVTGPDRPRVAAVRRDPRVSVVVRGPARSVTARGRCALRSDAEARGWVYAAFAARQAALHPELVDAEAFAGRLARLERMILEVAPERWITYDGARAALR